jgi:Zn-dependent M28 family amino/carboxypeptidase
LLGSYYYVKSLKAGDPAQLLAHKVNIDTDMIASPNYVRGVWDGSELPDPVLASKCKVLSEIFTSWFADQGLETTAFHFNGRSDFAAFLDSGIPASGVITGEDEIKTPDGAAKFGGISGIVLDPCYHQDCDRLKFLEGPGFDILEQNLNALANALHVLATKKDIDGFLNQSETWV